MRESLDKVSVLCSELVLLLVVTLLGLVTLMTVFLALFVVMIGWSPVMSDSDSKYIKVSKISNIAEYYIVEGRWTSEITARMGFMGAVKPMNLFCTSKIVMVALSSPSSDTVVR